MMLSDMQMKCCQENPCEVLMHLTHQPPATQPKPLSRQPLRWGYWLAACALGAVLNTFWNWNSGTIWHEFHCEPEISNHHTTIQICKKQRHPGPHFKLPACCQNRGTLRSVLTLGYPSGAVLPGDRYQQDCFEISNGLTSRLARLTTSRGTLPTLLSHWYPSRWLLSVNTIVPSRLQHRQLIRHLSTASACTLGDPFYIRW